MTRIKMIAFTIFMSVLVGSCNPNISDIVPKMKNDMDFMSKEISSKILFTQLALNATKSESTGERTSRNLDVVLTDASIRSFTKNELDFLSTQISSIVKHNVINVDTFDWVNIIYERTDGAPPSDFTNDNVYVFRPEEIK